MKNQEGKRPYWISITSPAHIAFMEGEEATDLEQEFENFLTELGFTWRKDERLYKTWGEEDAMRVKNAVEQKGGFV